MKLRLFTLLSLSLVFLANRGGRNAPAAGAPVDGNTNCSQCHSGGNFEADIKFTMTDMDGNLVEQYMPNTNYNIEIKGIVTGGNEPQTYGFQMVALKDDDTQSGVYESLGDNVRKLDFQDKGREYLIQSAPREDGTFTAVWTSPEAESGTVNIYTSVLAANGNGGTSGDTNISKMFTVAEAITSSTADRSALDFELFPNPVSNLLTVKGVERYSIIDASGNTILKHTGREGVDVSNLANGQYFIQAKGYHTAKFIKI